MRGQAMRFEPCPLWESFGGRHLSAEPMYIMEYKYSGIGKSYRNEEM